VHDPGDGEGLAFLVTGRLEVDFLQLAWNVDAEVVSYEVPHTLSMDATTTSKLAWNPASVDSQWPKA
jgi:hypothetical protein